MKGAWFEQKAKESGEDGKRKRGGGGTMERGQSWGKKERVAA